MTYTSNLSAPASAATFAYLPRDLARDLARELEKEQALNQSSKAATAQTGVSFPHPRHGSPSTEIVPTTAQQLHPSVDEVFTPACRRAQFIAAYPELGVTCERLQFCWDRAVKDWSGDPGWVLLECARAAKPPPPAPDLDWSYATIPELIDDIIATHHRPLRHELRRLGLIIRQFCRRHGEFRHLNFDQAYTLFADDLLGHMNHEEAEVFPMSIAIEGADQRLLSEDALNRNVTSAIRFMSVGHEGAIYAMHHLMALHDLMATRNIDPDLPLIHEGLTAMATNLVMHKMKETDILLPAVLFAEEQLRARQTTTYAMPWSNRH
jgi:iron-sulfur cluster repair protein YtfE (RIC family)